MFISFEEEIKFFDTFIGLLKDFSSENLNLFFSKFVMELEEL